MHLKIYLRARALQLILPTLFAHSIILWYKDSAHTHFDIVDLLRVMIGYFKYAISNMKMQLMCYKYWKLHPPYTSPLNVYSYFCHNCGHNLMKLYCKLRFVFITALNTLEHTHTITNHQGPVDGICICMRMDIDIMCDCVYDLNNRDFCMRVCEKISS